MFVVIFAVVAIVVSLVLVSRARQARWEREDEAELLAEQNAANAARFEAIMASYNKMEVAPATCTKDEAEEFAAKYF